MRVPDPKANNTTEAYLAYKAGYLEESELKPKLYKPDWHFDGWLAYWAGLTETYPTKENGDPEMLCDEEALVAYLSGVTDTYPEEIKDPYDVRIVGYLRHLASIRWPEPDYPVNNEEFYLSTMEPTHTSNPVPSSDIELDTAEGKIISVEAYGDTYQQTYSGANLYNVEDTQQTSAEVSVDSDGWITMQYDNSAGSSVKYLLHYSKPLQLEADTDYAIVTEIKSIKSSTDNLAVYDSAAQTQFNNSQIYNFSGSGAVSPGTYVSIGHTKADMSSATIGLRTFLKISAGVNQTVTFRISVLANTSVTPETFVYQPFTGNIPSPNPDYPQDVQVVTGEQTVTVTGKNLLDSLHGYVNGYIDSSGGIGAGGGTNALFDYIAVSPSSNYTLSQQGANVANAGIAYFDANKTFISREQTYSFSSQTYSTPKGCSYVRIWVYRGGGINQAIIENAKLQFEQGSSASSYYPYQGQQSYPISLGSTELCKIGNYQDYIYKSGDDWYVHKACGKVIWNGTETWSYDGSYPRASIAKPSDFGSAYQDQATTTKCTHFIAGNTASMDDSYNVGSSAIFFRASSIMTSLDNWKTWLSNNNMLFYYALASPTNTKITDATLVGQLEALAGADTYDGKTFIKVTTSDPNLPALLKVEAYKY